MSRGFGKSAKLLNREDLTQIGKVELHLCHNCHVDVLTDLGRLCQRHLVHLRSLSVKMLNRFPIFTLGVPPHPLHSVLGVNRGIRSLGCFIHPLDQYCLRRGLSVHQSQ